MSTGMMPALDASSRNKIRTSRVRITPWIDHVAVAEAQMLRAVGLAMSEENTKRKGYGAKRKG